MMIEHLQRAQSLERQVEEHGERILDTIYNSVFLNSVPKTYKVAVRILEYQDSITPEMIINRILVGERKIYMQVAIMVIASHYRQKWQEGQQTLNASIVVSKDAGRGIVLSGDIARKSMREELMILKRNRRRITLLQMSDLCENPSGSNGIMDYYEATQGFEIQNLKSEFVILEFVMLH